MRFFTQSHAAQRNTEPPKKITFVPSCLCVRKMDTLAGSARRLAVQHGEAPCAACNGWKPSLLYFRLSFRGEVV